MLRLKLLQAVGRLIMPGYKFQYPQMCWWEDQKFESYLAAFNEQGEFNAGRRFTLYQLARLIAAVPGDTAECGVYEGFSSFLICLATSNGQRTHFAFDSFEGLSRPGEADGSHWKAGDLSTPMERAMRNLSRFPNVSWQKGWIPERFAEAESRDFALVHIDVDLYGPTRDSLEFFYPRLNPGGIILCDDYACTTCPGATKAFDEYLIDKMEKMIQLPCGGGFLIKGTQTGAAS
ncbi:MAG TPA: TylF/MycF/NovP-related O-methyltransferase [Terriglobales bacterium]|nr:TylF/MycF/NovP-related O-methyltransferase [Terriglobales bacterium]